MIYHSSIIDELNTFPNQAAVWSILSNVIVGHQYILANNTAVILIEDCNPEPFVFIAGKPSLEAIDEALIYCQKYKCARIYCLPKWHSLLIAKKWKFHLRIEFALNKLKSFPIPPNVIVKPIDKLDLFKQCQDFKEQLERYGSTDKFFKFCSAYALCQGEEILSEAYTVFKGKRYAEISIITNPKYLKHGHAATVASFLIHKVQEMGMIPVWSCDADNYPSIKTALKIGFNIDRYYIQMIPENGNVSIHL